MLLLLSACEAVNDPGDSAAVETPDETVDVLVVGSGPAGSAAALEARDAGATVAIFERSTEAGTGVRLGGLGFGVGTRWQSASGVSDSVDAAAAEWSSITGASGDLAGVRDFLEHSAENLEWLEAHGAEIAGPWYEQDAGTTPRIHEIGFESDYPFDKLMADYDGELRTGTEVTGPWMVDGELRGVRWTDLATGNTGITGAKAVVIATGGFLRNRDRVNAVAPELADRELVFETNTSSDGGGLPFLDAVGAGSLSPEDIGMYVHSVRDPGKPEGEALVAMTTRAAVLVGEDATRFIDEMEAQSFDLFRQLPPGEIYTITAGRDADSTLFMRPAYNWSVPGKEEFYVAQEVLEMGADDVFVADTLGEAAALAGLDPTALQETIDAYNTAATTGTADETGRTPGPSDTIDGEPVMILRLTPGLAKAFGGVATDEGGRVLDPSGAAIPRLLAAGEVAGMVLGGGGGDGFAGSVNACYWGGRVAGSAGATLAAQ